MTQYIYAVFFSSHLSYECTMLNCGLGILFSQQVSHNALHSIDEHDRFECVMLTLKKTYTQVIVHWQLDTVNDITAHFNDDQSKIRRCSARFPKWPTISKEEYSYRQESPPINRVWLGFFVKSGTTGRSYLRFLISNSYLLRRAGRTLKSKFWAELNAYSSRHGI